MQLILTFGLEKQKIKVVRNIAQKNNIFVKEIAPKDYRQKIGTLAGIDGFTREKAFYNGPDFPLEMMVFSGIDSEQMDKFLADYKQTGEESVPLKAIVTPRNIFWTAEKLFHELWEEHLRFL